MKAPRELLTFIDRIAAMDCTCGCRGMGSETLCPRRCICNGCDAQRLVLKYRDGPINREVRYRVPVYVTIEAGKVTRVAVDDESAERAEDVPPEVLEILETEAWPSWEFGL